MSTKQKAHKKKSTKYNPKKIKHLLSNNVKKSIRMKICSNRHQNHQQCASVSSQPWLQQTTINKKI
jgi:hypothetical protein